MKHALLAVCLLATPAFGQIATEDFTAGNTHLWARDHITVATHNTTGGNPGGMIQVTMSNSMSNLSAPMLMPSSIGHPWAGDFQVQGVSSFSFDREVVSGTSNFGTFPYLVLGTNNGTPNVLMDDVMVFVPTGDDFQFMPEPWENFEIPIPSQDTFLPAGWFAEALPNSPIIGQSDDDLWLEVIRDVDYIGIAMGRPWMGIWFGSHTLNFDNFELKDTGVTTGTPFCSPMEINSTGLSTTLTGSLGGAGSSGLHLEANNGPSGEFGYFLSGTAFAEPGLDVSNGRLCLGTAPGDVIGRYNQTGTNLNSVGQFDSGGRLQNIVGTSSISSGFDVPSTLPMPGNPMITAGSTWHFQVWHRDTPAAPGTSNFSNGLSVTF